MAPVRGFRCGTGSRAPARLMGEFDDHGTHLRHQRIMLQAAVSYQPVSTFFTYLSLPVVRQKASAESRVAVTFDLEVLCPREERNASMVAIFPLLSCARNALHVMSPPLPLALDPLDEEPSEFELDDEF